MAGPGFEPRQSNSRTHPLNRDIVCLWLGSLEVDSEMKIFRQADFWGVELSGSAPVEGGMKKQGLKKRRS